jgi:hypothetical protein
MAAPMARRPLLTVSDHPGGVIIVRFGESSILDADNEDQLGDELIRLVTHLDKWFDVQHDEHSALDGFC